ncbi:MAG: hypothetical protein PF517_12690 [Salinivirgaceae bacterium]|jgi:cobalt/nickel transport system permease protein|nr:hypothetical protein [Salinivirgaceae bacterium]
MLIEEIYNHNQKLANYPLAIKAAFVFPALLLVLISHSVLFDLLVFGVFLVLNKFLLNTSMRNLLLLFKYPVLFVLVGSITIAITTNSASPFFIVSRFSFGFDSVNSIVAKQVFCRSLAILSLVYFYVLSNTISDISEGMYFCKLPKLFIELFVLCYKFIFNLFAVSKSILVAQKCRLAYSYNGNNLLAFSFLASTIFKRAMFQTTQLEVALSSRLGEGDFSFISPKKLFEKRQLIAPVLFFVILFSLFLILENYG